MKTIPSHPVCIASPVRRSGTTLIQRLLCSAPNTLIYGETCANDLSILTNLLVNKQFMFSQRKNWSNRQLEAVLDGSGLNDWIPDLLPEIDGYLNAYQDALFSHVQHFGSFAQQKGRTVWGMKMPEWHPPTLLQIAKLLPQMKIIYLCRDLADCVRSAKKIEMVKGIGEIRQFCNTYQQFSNYAQVHLKGPNVLNIEYADLVAEPKAIINQLEKFTGAKGIDRKIMDVKVNTYADDRKLKIGEGPYLQPAELTQEEMEVVRSFVPKSEIAMT